jgi:hypothetical protein
LRTLQRIERTLAARPRAFAITEDTKVAETIEAPREPAWIPFAPKPSHGSQSGVATRDILTDKSVAVAPAADRTSPSVPAIALAAGPDATVETIGQAPGKKNGNGAAGVRTGFRVSGNLRRTNAGERQSGPALDASWPKGPRPSRAVEGGSLAQSNAVAPIQSQQNADTLNAAASASNPDSAAASVLKSGIVNGMPYTLYSDGSIEAQLPEGTVRFGSITELRNHIEQSA